MSGTIQGTQRRTRHSCLVTCRYALRGLIRLLTFWLLLWLFKEPLSGSLVLSQLSQVVSSCLFVTQAVWATCKWGIISTHSHCEKIYVYIVILNSSCWKLLVVLSLCLGEQVPEREVLKGPVVIYSEKARRASPVRKRMVGLASKSECCYFCCVQTSLGLTAMEPGVQQGQL